MPAKLKSRKFLVAIIGAAAIAALTQLGLDAETAAKLVAALLGTYIAGESFIDGKSAGKPDL